MLIFLVVLITIACILLTLVVLIQNPKGGGLGATFGGFSNQMMGVQRTPDFLEKATWTLAIVLIVFSMLTKFWTGPGTTSMGQPTPPQTEQPVQN